MGPTINGGEKGIFRNMHLRMKLEHGNTAADRQYVESSMLVCHGTSLFSAPSYKYSAYASLIKLCNLPHHRQSN